MGHGSSASAERMCLVELIAIPLTQCEVALAPFVSCVCGFTRAHSARKAWHLPDMSLVTKWFHSTRLETRTKESNICASSWVVKPTCAMKVITEILASAADRSIGRGLSMSISVRTRKMVNYA